MVGSRRRKWRQQQKRYSYRKGAVWRAALHEALLPTSIYYVRMYIEGVDMSQPTKRAPLRVGIIGAGWPGERHAEGYLADGAAQVVAISDLEPARRAAFAARYGATRTYAD